jgi:DNA-binding response OmpR family regulator
MDYPIAILVCERDTLFREALRNFLLSAGYTRLDMVATVREALAKLRREKYCHIVVGLSPPLASKQRLAKVARKRQSGAKVLFVVGADDAPFIEGASMDYVLKEHVFSVLLDLLAQKPYDSSSHITRKSPQ